MIGINLDRAAEITHARRRFARSAEFAPLDVEATVPSRAESAEAARAVVRSRYAEIQTRIDEATSADELLEIIGVEGI